MQPRELFPAPRSDLEEASRTFFAEAAGAKGTTCPCCERFGKIYVRRLNAGIATTLIYLYQHARAEYVHLPSTAPRYILKDNQVGKLAFWGLAECMPNELDSRKKKSGWWRITARGEEFVQGAIQVPSHVVEYDHRVREFRGAPVSITDALGRPFDYRELMAAHP